MAYEILIHKHEVMTSGHLHVIRNVVFERSPATGQLKESKQEK
jgi:hypothetical protein